MIQLDGKLKDLHSSCSLWSVLRGRSFAGRKEKGGKDFKFCELVLGLYSILPAICVCQSISVGYNTPTLLPWS